MKSKIIPEFISLFEYLEETDCPFFIDNEPKMVEGIGEKMNKCNLDLSNFKIKLINPRNQAKGSKNKTKYF